MYNREIKKRCFIIGNGSSITSQNLELLKDEIVLAVSGFYLHEKIHTINPKYYVLPPVFEAHKQYSDELNYYRWLDDMDKTLDNTTIMFCCQTDKIYIEKYKLFEKKEIVYVNYFPYKENNILSDIDIYNMPSIWSVSESAIQIALYLGFKEIFILGFDHDWFNGALVHFNDKYLKHFNKKLQKELVSIHGVDSEFQMIRHAKIFNKYKKLYAIKENIYNVNFNQNTYVDTFPIVDYNKLFIKGYKSYIKRAKDNFIQIQSKSLSLLYDDYEDLISNKDLTKNNLNFSIQINKLYEQLNSLKKYKCVIYGYGYIGKLVHGYLLENIIACVDKKSSLITNSININTVYCPSMISCLQYDKIIICALGREKELEYYLQKELSIHQDKIFRFYL